MQSTDFFFFFLFWSFLKIHLHAVELGAFTTLLVHKSAAIQNVGTNS